MTNSVAPVLSSTEAMTSELCPPTVATLDAMYVR
jgi:hypothetical protein